MKPQDILFFILLAALIYKKNPYYLVWSGLVCIAISIPLFAKHIFFTAEHLTWYAAGFFLFSIVLLLIKMTNNKR